MYFGVNSEIFCSQEGKHYQSTGRVSVRVPFFPSSHLLPPTFLTVPRNGWGSLKLGEMIREAHLAVDLGHVLPKTLPIKFMCVFPSV